MLKYIEIEVPDIGDFNSSPISRVLVSEGDEVALGAPLVTVKRKRKTLDIPSPAAGRVFELLVDVGDPMAQGTSILVMETVVPDHQSGTAPSSEETTAPLADEVAQVAASLEPDAQKPKGAQGSFDFPEHEGPQGTAPRDDPDIGEPHSAKTKTAEAEARTPLAEAQGTSRPGAESGQASPAPQDSSDDDMPSGTQTAIETPARETKPTATEVVPDIGDFETVEVIEVHIGNGDTVEIDDPLITLESDKASMAVPATCSGEVVEVLLEVGDKVRRGVEIARLLTAAPPIADESAQGDDRPDIELPAPPAQKPTAVPATPVAAPSASPSTAAPSPPQTLPPPTATQSRVPHASPAVRLFARELGVDLSQVQGSGRNDRILVEDVQSHVRNRIANGDPGAAPALPGIPQIDFSRFGPVETQPMSRIRKRAATNLHRAWLNIPHVTHHDLADITTLDAFRLEMKEEATAAGVRLTMLAFVLKACAVVLQRHPTFNASLDSNGDNLVLKHYYHVGVAVDTADGLVVPVIRDVDKKGIYELANDLAAVSVKARDQKLQASDMQGASFTVSSLGGVGGIAFTPIVNAPEVAILGLSRSSLKPVYIDGAFVARLMLPLSLSYDHRAIDGAQAARFLVDLAKILGDARRILL